MRNIWQQAHNCKLTSKPKTRACRLCCHNINFGARLEKQENTYDAFGMSVGASRNPGTYSLALNQALFRPQAWENHKQGPPDR